MSPNRKAFIVFFLLLPCLGLAACGGGQAVYTPDSDPDASAAALFEEGNNAMRGGNYVSSVGLYTRLKDEYPFSPYAIEAELSLADAYYLDQEWLLAAEAYKDFESQHPRHTAIPYVLFQIGMTGLNMYTSVDRPPTVVVEALSYFSRLRDSFAGHEYARKAEERIGACRRLLAEYEAYTGDFFFRTGNYYAAWQRYMIILREYPDIDDLRGYAERRRHMAYFLHVRKNSEEKRRFLEDTWHNWLDWL